MSFSEQVIEFNKSVAMSPDDTRGKAEMAMSGMNIPPGAEAVVERFETTIAEAVSDANLVKLNNTSHSRSQRK